jgi:DNA-binding NtrC family response regulator
MTNRVLIIDNDEALCKLIKTILDEEEYETKYFVNPYDAVADFKGENYSLVITDIKMPGMDGIDVLEHIKRINPLVPVIIITAHATVDITIQALRKGADDIITKPFEAPLLIYRVKNALKNKALREENRQLKQELINKSHFENIIGISPSIKKILDTIEKIAPYDIPVLIYGESGTGKELIAKAIHNNSPRKDKPFIAINCGSLPSSLMESELFGHKKGAFTGATEDKVGLIEAGNGGTIFLDEIGTLPMEVQKVLLRFLQEKELRRVGDTKTVNVDVRIISATNIDLKSAISKGIFREDLYYRLNGITINLPPLRERIEDIPLLSSHFISIQNKRFNLKCAGFTQEAMEALKSYNWPGNIRQLKNVVEAAMAISSDRYIGVDILQQFIEIDKIEVLNKNETLGDYYKSLENFEREYFKNLLDKNKWDIELSAKEAGINMATIYRKIKKLSIHR